jgi:hypothetical protein
LIPLVLVVVLVLEIPEKSEDENENDDEEDGQNLIFKQALSAVLAATRRARPEDGHVTTTVRAHIEAV